MVELGGGGGHVLGGVLVEWDPDGGNLKAAKTYELSWMC